MPTDRCGTRSASPTKFIAKGGRAAALKADLTHVEETERLIGAAVEAVGPLGLLVNSASLFKDDDAMVFEADKWDAHFAIHARAPVILTQRFAAQCAGRRGLVVNIIDERVWRLTPKVFSYTLSKATLWTATRTLAQALAPNIRVNAIGPGPTLPNERQTEAQFRRQSSRVLLGSGPGLDEFGRTIRYLFDTPSVTGQMIALDGGQHLAWRAPDNTDIGE